MQHATASRASGSRQAPAAAAVSRAREARGDARDVLALQETIGNQALVQRLQARLAGRPLRDAHEQDADRVADRLVAPGPAGCSCGGRCSKCGARTLSPAPSDLAPAGGSPLSAALRAYFEPRLGRDLAGVYLHTDETAARLAASAGALAFTQGSHVVFGKGQYAPDTPPGRHLLAHELAHIVQQADHPSAVPSVQLRPDPDMDVGPVSSVRISCADMRVVFSTARAAYAYTLTSCEAPVGTYDTGVSVSGNNVDWDFGTVLPGERFFFGYEVRAGQVNPARLFRGQRRVTIEILESLPAAEPTAPALTLQADLATRLASFKQLVKNAGIVRLRLNSRALAQWLQFLQTRLTPAQVQGQAQAQEAQEVIALGESTGGLRAAEDWMHTRGPAQRWVLRQQAGGRYRACTGCHAMVQATDMDYQRQLAEGGRRPTPLEMLDIAAQGERQAPSARPEGAPEAGPTAEHPGYPGVTQAAQRISEIRPFLQQLGPSGYKVLPPEVMGSTATPQQLMADINNRFAQRQADYREFARRIAQPDFDYLDLRPIVRDLLPSADLDVQEAVEAEIARARAWEIVETVVIVIASIGLLLLMIFPPTTALGVAGALTLGALVSAHQIYRGIESYEQGQTWSLGTGAHDVLDPDQQQAADMMMAMGVLNVVLGAVGLASAAVGGVRLIRAAPAGPGQLGALESMEATAGGNNVRVTGLNTSNPQVRVTGPNGQVIHEGPGTALAQRGPWTPRVIQGGGAGTPRAAAPPPAATAPPVYEAHGGAAVAVRPAPQPAPAVAPAPRHLQVVPDPVPAPVPAPAPAPVPAAVPAPALVPAPVVPRVPPTILAPLPGVAGDIVAGQRRGTQPSTTPSATTSPAPQPAAQPAPRPEESERRRRVPQPYPLEWPLILPIPPQIEFIKVPEPSRDPELAERLNAGKWVRANEAELRGRSLAAHHVVPLFLGGADLPSNVILWNVDLHNRGHACLRIQPQMATPPPPLRPLPPDLLRHPPGTRYRLVDFKTC